MADWVDYLQWPAMAVTIAAGVLVSSSRPGRRKTGFVSFLFSNLLWIVWGLHDSAYALITLQLSLAVTNVRGLRNNEGQGNEPAGSK